MSKENKQCKLKSLLPCSGGTFTLSRAWLTLAGLSNINYSCKQFKWLQVGDWSFRLQDSGVGHPAPASGFQSRNHLHLLLVSLFRTYSKFSTKKVLKLRATLFYYDARCAHKRNKQYKNEIKKRKKNRLTKQFDGNQKITTTRAMKYIKL